MSNKFDTLKHHVDNSDSGSGDEDSGPNITDLGPIEYPPGEHRLQHSYCLWFSKRPSQIQGSQGYSQVLRLVGQIGTVEQWWALYSHMVRLQDIPSHRDIHLFKKGIKPMWEDPANKKGGKWVEYFHHHFLCDNGYKTEEGAGRKGVGKLVPSYVRGTVYDGNEICGVVISTRYHQEYVLSIWNRTASDQVTNGRIRDALKRLLNIPPSATMEYKTHNDCLKYGASKVIPNNALKS